MAGAKETKSVVKEAQRVTLGSGDLYITPFAGSIPWPST